jgi:hypothetical protein
VAQGVVDEHCARWIGGGDDIAGAGHADGGQALRFQMTGNQTDGLMADRS